MPAASDPQQLPSLPRTWRPTGVRIALAFFGLMMFIVFAGAWFGFPPDVRARFTTLQRGTLLGLGAAFWYVGWLLWRCRATAEMESLVIVNGWRTRTYAWEEVLSVEMGPGAPWATLDLADGTSISVLGFQGTDGAKAHQGVDELRALINRRGPA
jgi:hypothetical protein